MFRRSSTILVLAAGISIASAAQAAPVANGLTVNGLSANGLTVNGLSANGLTVNGFTVNGLSANGAEVRGRSRDGGSGPARPEAVILQDGSVVLLK